MRATSAIQAATEQGGFDLAAARREPAMTAEQVRGYFSAAEFARIFPGEDCAECGGYSLADCTEAVIAELGL